MDKFARAVVIKDGKLLLIKRDKFGFKFYAFPGGKVEAGESLETAAEREVMEEAMVSVKLIKPVFKHVTEQFGDQTYFLAEYISGEPKIQPGAIEDVLNKRGENIFEPVWVSLRDLKDTNVLPVSARDKVIKYAESGFPNEVETLEQK